MPRDLVQTKTIREVLRSIGSFSGASWVYLSKEEAWTPDSPCLVLVSAEVAEDLEDDPDAGIPEMAQRLQMTRALTVAEVQDIVGNARSQKPEADDETLFKAFLHYYTTTVT